MTHTLDLAAAMQIATGALDWARQADCKPISLVVLDAGGHVKLAVRGDGAGHFGIAIATAKAAGVLGFNVPSSRVLGDIFSAQPAMVAALSAVTDARFLPTAGAVQIRDANGILLGAAAAAGGMPDQDEQAAQAGIHAAGF